MLYLVKPGCVLYTWGHTWGKSSTASSSGSVPLHHRVTQVGPENSPSPALTTPTLSSQRLRSPCKATFLPKDPTNPVECPGKHRALPGGTLWNQELGLSAKQFSAAHRFDLCQFSCLNSGTLGLALGDLRAESVRFLALDLEVVLPA